MKSTLKASTSLQGAIGNLFENLVITEALKTRLNSGAEPNLYFFRNSKGLEVDLILKKENKLRLFEIKSGKSLNDEFTKNMDKFITLYSDQIDTEKTHGTVIYSGDDYSSYKDYAYANFHKTYELFRNDDKPYVLEF